MSEHKHVFTYAPYGDLHDRPNAILVCDCGLRILDAYHAACEERDDTKQRADYLIRNFDAAIRKIATELTNQACGGVDTEDNINPKTGEPYGPGGHTGWLLASEARKLRTDLSNLRIREIGLKTLLKWALPHVEKTEVKNKIKQTLHGLEGE